MPALKKSFLLKTPEAGHRESLQDGHRCSEPERRKVKTTTVANVLGLAKGTRRQGLPPAKVLLIDLDPQGNCATSFGLEKKKIKKTVYDLLTNDSGEELPLMEEYLIPPEEITKAMREAWSNRNGGKKVPDTIDAGHLYILPSDIHLSGAEIELSHKIGRETRLQEIVAHLDEFDYIIIDTPPSLGLLSINAMCAANWVMVPVRPEYYAEGFSMLMNSIKMIQRRDQPKPEDYRYRDDHGGRSVKAQHLRLRPGEQKNAQQALQHHRSAVGQGG